MGGPTGPKFEIVFHPAAAKEFWSLSKTLQRRFEAAIDQLEVDPFRARPGLDIKKLTDIGHGESLFRLRVGDHRSCYAVVTAERRILMLVFENREAGYGRIAKTALSRRSRFAR